MRREQIPYGGNSLRRGSVKGRGQGLVHLQLLRKTPSTRLYTALAWAWVVVVVVVMVDFCFSSLKSFCLGWEAGRGRERRCGGGGEGESGFYPEKKGKRV